MFAKIDQILHLNFDTEEITTIYKFQQKFQMQPVFFRSNLEQDILIVASSEDCIYIDNKGKIEVDIDKEYKVSAIKEIIHDFEDGVFYILANKLEGLLGFFVFTIKEKDPHQSKFYIKYKNKLDIGDTDINVLRDPDNRVKELVISYKSIYINTYNVIVLDISDSNGGNLGQNSVVFRHESF